MITYLNNGSFLIFSITARLSFMFWASFKSSVYWVRIFIGFVIFFAKLIVMHQMIRNKITVHIKIRIAK